jgi:hypothetical protein
MLWSRYLQYTVFSFDTLISIDVLIKTTYIKGLKILTIIMIIKVMLIMFTMVIFKKGRI